MKKHLVAQRSGHRGVATKTRTMMSELKAENIPDTDKAEKLERLLTDLNSRLQTISGLDTQIYAETTDEELENEVLNTEEYNFLLRDEIGEYLSLLMRLKIKMGVFEEPSSATNYIPSENATVTLNPSRTSHRPKINLPIFDGDILQWQPFWQAFDSEIHSDENLANISKFNYLLGQLAPEVKLTGRFATIK